MSLKTELVDDRDAQEIKLLKKAIFAPGHQHGMSIDRWTNIDMPEAMMDALVYGANTDDKLALRWIRRLYKHRVTASLLTELQRRVRGVRLNGYLELNPSSKKFEWKADISHRGLDRDALYALVVVWLVNAGAVDGLKRCALEDCREYFIGSPRAKWCSENCGSKHRIRKKRKLDKQRQML